MNGLGGNFKMKLKRDVFSNGVYNLTNQRKNSNLWNFRINYWFSNRIKKQQFCFISAFNRTEINNSCFYFSFSYAVVVPGCNFPFDTFFFSLCCTRAHCVVFLMIIFFFKISWILENSLFELLQTVWLHKMNFS